MDQTLEGVESIPKLDELAQKQRAPAGRFTRATRGHRLEYAAIDAGSARRRDGAVTGLPALLLCTALLGCSAASSSSRGAPPPPPRQGLPVAPATLSADPAAQKKPCGCTLGAAPVSAQPPPSPISGDLPQGPFDLERRSACTAPVCRLDGFVPDASFVSTTREGVPSTAAVWLETIAADSTLVTPKSRELHALALVLEGSVSFGEGDPKPRATKGQLETWGALKAPDAGYYLQARGGRASVLMVVVAKNGTLLEALERAKKKPDVSPGGRLETADLRTAHKLSWAGGAYHARIAFAGPTPEFSASLTLIQATGSGAIAEHLHSAEWEHISILRGSGDMLLGSAKYAIEPGAVFHTPQGTLHGWNGAGTELAAVLVYSPAGPEQRFVNLAGKKPSEAQ